MQEKKRKKKRLNCFRFFSGHTPPSPFLPCSCFPNPFRSIRSPRPQVPSSGVGWATGFQGDSPGERGHTGGGDEGHAGHRQQNGAPAEGALPGREPGVGSEEPPGKGAQFSRAWAPLPVKSAAEPPLPLASPRSSCAPLSLHEPSSPGGHKQGSRATDRPTEATVRVGGVRTHSARTHTNTSRPGASLPPWDPGAHICACPAHRPDGWHLGEEEARLDCSAVKQIQC